MQNALGKCINCNLHKCEPNLIEQWGLKMCLFCMSNMLGAQQYLFLNVLSLQLIDYPNVP